LIGRAVRVELAFLLGRIEQVDKPTAAGTFGKGERLCRAPLFFEESR
jgi:hypothetical protein